MQTETLYNKTFHRIENETVLLKVVWLNVSLLDNEFQVLSLNKAQI